MLYAEYEPSHFLSISLASYIHGENPVTGSDSSAEERR